MGVTGGEVEVKQGDGVGNDLGESEGFTASHMIRSGKISTQETPPRTLGRGGSQREDTDVVE